MSLKDKTIATWLLNTNSNSTVGGNNGTDTAVTYNGDSASFLRSTSSKILIADSSVFTFGTSNFEILVWVKRNGTGIREIFVGQSNAAGSDASISFVIEFTAANVLQALVNLGGVIITVPSTSSVTDTNWHMVTLSRNGTTLRVKLDNNTGGSMVSAASVNNTTFQFGIGCAGLLAASTLGLNGSVSQVVIFNDELTTAERTEAYNGGYKYKYPFNRNGGILAFFMS